MRLVTYVSVFLLTCLLLLALAMPEREQYAGVLALMFLGSLVLAIAEGTRK